MLCARCRMALTYRTNLNVPLLINNVYYKFSTGVTKLTSSTECLQDRLKGDNTSLKNKFHNQSRNKLTFNELIRQKKEEACRSILVQVRSDNSYHDLHAYCSLYGNIVNMYYYKLQKESADKEQHFFLVEYKSAEDVQNVLSNTSFLKEDVIPVRTSILWFRKGREEPKLEPWFQKRPLFTEINRIPSDEQIARALASASDVSSQIAWLYNELKLNDLEMKLRFQIIIQFEQSLKSLFPNVNVDPFGSSITGFGSKACDFDLKLSVDKINLKTESSKLIFQSKHLLNSERTQTQEFMGTVADIMQHFMPGMQQVQRILRARVPIIKFYHAHTGVNCDLSMTQDSAIYMTELLRLFGQIDFRVRPLVFIIKKWAQTNNLTSSKPGRTITNFPITLLVLFYLQQRKILPTISYLQNFVETNEISDNPKFIRNVSKLPKQFFNNIPTDNLDDLLRGFFHYYLQFDFETKAVCLLEGKVMQKPMASVPMYIQNPFEETQNVSKNISLYDLHCILNSMRNGLDKLEINTKSLKNNWGILSWLKPRTSKSVDSVAPNASDLRSKKGKNTVKMIEEIDNSTNVLFAVSPEKEKKAVKTRSTVKIVNKI